MKERLKKDPLLTAKNWDQTDKVFFLFYHLSFRLSPFTDSRGMGVLPYKGLMGMCGQPGYVFWDFCLKQGIDFINFCLKQGIFS